MESFGSLKISLAWSIAVCCCSWVTDFMPCKSCIFAVVFSLKSCLSLLKASCSRFCLVSKSTSDSPASFSVDKLDMSFGSMNCAVSAFARTLPCLSISGSCKRLLTISPVQCATVPNPSAQFLIVPLSVASFNPLEIASIPFCTSSKAPPSARLVFSFVHSFPSCMKEILPVSMCSMEKAVFIASPNNSKFSVDPINPWWTSRVNSCVVMWSAPAMIRSAPGTSTDNCLINRRSHRPSDWASTRVLKAFAVCSASNPTMWKAWE